MKTVKLYGYANSPFVRKTTCFLYYKGIDFTHIPVDPIKPKKTIGFTGSSQVPVLQINNEWRHESSEHAYWLDREFPDKPLCPEGEEEIIRMIDEWISQTFLLNIFRMAIDGKLDVDYLRSAWRLATLMNTNSHVPLPLRVLWPFLIRNAPFIRDMGHHMNLSESHEDMDARIQAELKAHLGKGPFMGELESPTMLDLAVYPNIIWSYMFGVTRSLGMVQDPDIKSWLKRVAVYLPDNPSLTPDKMMIHTSSTILN